MIPPPSIACKPWCAKSCTGRCRSGSGLICSRSVRHANPTLHASSPSRPPGRRFPIRRLISRVALTALLAVVAAPPLAATNVDAEGDAARKLDAAYQFALGRLLYEENDYEGAREAYQRAVELDGRDPYGHLELAQLYSFLGQISQTREARLELLLKAAESAGEARRLAPENTDVLKGYAQVHMRLAEQRIDSLSFAQEAFEILHEKTPDDLQVLTSLGQIYLWKRQPAQAAEVLREAANILPEHRALQAMLIDALNEAGQSEQAVEALERMVKIDPNSIEHRLQLAELRGREGDHRAAAEVLRSAPESLQKDLRVRRALAQELHLSGDHVAALGEIDALLESMPEGRGLHRLRLAILMGLTRYEAAIDELRPILAKGSPDGERIQDLILLSRLHERLGQADEAADALRSAVEATEDAERRLRLRLAVAGLLERQGRAEQAIADLWTGLESENLDEVAALAPALAEILTGEDRADEALAMLEETAGRLAEAGRHSEADALALQRLMVLAEAERWADLVDAAPRIYDTDPPDIGTNARLLAADALVELGRLEDALQLLDGVSNAPRQRRLAVAKRIDLLFGAHRESEARAMVDKIAAGGEDDDLFFAAQLYQRAELYADVIPLMAKLLDKVPDSQPALFLKAAAHERLGQREEAVADFQRLLELAPDHPAALNYLGYMWAEKGEHLDQALTLIQRAVALDPDNGAYVDSLGWVYYQIGNYQTARGHLEWAVVLISDDDTVHDHLGDVYLKLGERELAKEAYERAIALEGDALERARRKLEQLNSGSL